LGDPDVVTAKRDIARPPSPRSSRSAGRSPSRKIARLLAKLDSLSPEEVERMLAERGAGPEG
jgi:hypothetical protein